MKLRLSFNVGRQGDADVLMTRTVKADYVVLTGLGVGNTPTHPIECRSEAFPFRVLLLQSDPDRPGTTYEAILTVEEIDD